MKDAAGVDIDYGDILDREARADRDIVERATDAFPYQRRVEAAKQWLGDRFICAKPQPKLKKEV